MVMLSRAEVFAVVIGLVVFHLLTIDRQSFFVDEVSELMIACKPVAEIVVEADSMPPLYPLVNKMWLGVWGTDHAARWLSVLFSLLTVVAIWKTARDELGVRAGIAAVLLAAICPFLLYYSQFVRAYALYCTLFAWLMFVFLRARRTNSWFDWATFAAIGIAGCYTHYYFPLYLLTAGIVIAVEQKLVGLRPIVWVAFLAIAVAVAPVLALLKIDMSYQLGIRNSRPLDIAALGYTYASYWTGYCLGPSKTDLHQLTAGEAARLFAPWAALLAVALLPIGYYGWGVLRKHGLLWPIVAFLVLPVAISGLLGPLLDLTYNVRFVAPCVVPFLLWLAAGIGDSWDRRSTRFATAVLMLLAVVAITNRQVVDRYKNEDIRTACGYVEQNAAAAEPVFVISDYMAHVVRYYAPDERPVWQLPDDDAMSLEIHDIDGIRQAVDTIRDRAVPGQPYWLVYSRPFHGDPHGLLLDRLLDEQAIVLERGMAGVELYRGQLVSQPEESSAEEL